MAELSTVARPYAEGLMEALLGRKASAAEMAQVLSTIEHLAATVGDPQVLQLATDPKVTKEKLFDLIVDVVGKLNPVEAENLLRVVIDNGRLSIFPEIAKQFRQLTGVSGDDCIIGCFDYKGGTALYVVNYSRKEKADITLSFDKDNYRYSVIQRGQSTDVVGGRMTLTLDAGEAALVVLS